MSHQYEALLAAIPVAATRDELDKLELGIATFDDPEQSVELYILAEERQKDLAAIEAGAATAAAASDEAASNGAEQGEAEVSATGAMPAQAAASDEGASGYRLDEVLPKDDFPHKRFKKTKDGMEIAGLVCSIENLTYMLECYGVKLRYNEMTRLREIKLPAGMPTGSGDNADERAMDRIENLAVINGMNFGTQRLSGVVSTIAEQDCYHPVRRWIGSKPWDGVSRFEALCDTLAVKNDDLAKHRNAMMRRWLIAGAAALYSKSFKHKFELALTLQGFQGKGKSNWFLSLLPTELMAVKDNMELDPRNKDHVFTLAGHHIVELGELDSTFSKSEVGRLKSFLSNTSDKLRRPYARTDSVMKRQTLIGASVNKPDFLIDDTGNRRWLTVPIIGVDYMHTIDMQQVWAEMKVAFESGEQWWLTDDERAMLDRVNENFEVTSPIAELLSEAFDFTEPAAQLPGMPVAEVRRKCNVTATQVVCLFNFPKDRKNVGEASSALRKLTGEDWVKSNGQKVWHVFPNRKSRYFTMVQDMLGVPA